MLNFDYEFNNMYLVHVLVQVPGTVPVIVHIRTTILLLKIHIEDAGTLGTWYLVSV